MTRAALLLALALSGCAANVPIILDFPTTRAFDISELVRIDVVPLAEGELGDCPRLLDSAARGDVLETVASSEIGVCEALGGVSMPDPGNGARAFLAQVVDDRNAVILSGCAVAEAYPGASVTIELLPTADYTASADRLSETAVRAGGACRGGGS